MRAVLSLFAAVALLANQVHAQDKFFSSRNVTVPITAGDVQLKFVAPALVPFADSAADFLALHNLDASNVNAVVAEAERRAGDDLLAAQGVVNVNGRALAVPQRPNETLVQAAATFVVANGLQAEPRVDRLLRAAIHALRFARGARDGLPAYSGESAAEVSVQVAADDSRILEVWEGETPREAVEGFAGRLGVGAPADVIAAIVRAVEAALEAKAAAAAAGAAQQQQQQAAATAPPAQQQQQQAAGAGDSLSVRLDLADRPAITLQFPLSAAASQEAALDSALRGITQLTEAGSLPSLSAEQVASLQRSIAQELLQQAAQAAEQAAAEQAAQARAAAAAGSQLVTPIPASLSFTFKVPELSSAGPLPLEEVPASLRPVEMPLSVAAGEDVGVAAAAFCAAHEGAIAARFNYAAFRLREERAAAARQQGAAAAPAAVTPVPVFEPAACAREVTDFVVAHINGLLKGEAERAAAAEEEVAA